MGFLRYINILYFIVFITYALVVTGRQRIKELLPVSVISMIIVGTVTLIGINLGLFRFNIPPFLNVFGMPFFHLLWAGTAGIILIDYMKPSFSHNLQILIYATAVIQVMAYIAELAGVFQRLGSYNYYYNALIDFASLNVILLISESLYKYRIYTNNRVK